MGDINQLALPAAAFDLILSVDTLYFSEDYAATLAALKKALKPGGQLAIFFSYGREPWVPLEQFPRDCLSADKTPLAVALQATGLTFSTWTQLPAISYNSEPCVVFSSLTTTVKSSA